MKMLKKLCALTVFFIGASTYAAVNKLEKKVKISRPTAHSFYLLGQGYTQLGDYQKAEKNFKKTIDLEHEVPFELFSSYSTASFKHETGSFGCLKGILLSRQRSLLVLLEILFDRFGHCCLVG